MAYSTRKNILSGTEIVIKWLVVMRNLPVLPCMQRSIVIADRDRLEALRASTFMRRKSIRGSHIFHKFYAVIAATT